MDLRPQTLPIDKVGSSVWFRSTQHKGGVMCDEATFARAELHDFRGKAKRQAREMREMLLVAESALKSGRTEVAEQRIAAVLRVLTAQLGD